MPVTSLLDQSGTQEAYRGRYGGSDSTAPSFNRPQYHKFNSITKSRDFGPRDNLAVTLTGVVGGHTGCSTLFFRVQTLGTTRISVKRNDLGSIDDRLISVGILDGEHNPIALGDGGYAEMAPLAAEATSKTNDRLAPGVYFFTVSTNQWRAIHFSIDAVVQRYLECAGAATLQCTPRLRLALVKLTGVASGTAVPTAQLLAPAKAKKLNGAAAGAMTPQLTLSIMRGVATGRMEPYGRLQQNYKIEGAAIGANTNIATMTARRPYGYGY